MQRFTFRKIKIGAIGLVLAAGLSTSSIQAEEMTTKQQNAIAMLNYVSVLTQDIIESKNSKLKMEEAYSNLVNNTMPNTVDSLTLEYIMELLDAMEKYRMLAVKRERLEYIYQKNQAEAIRSLVPNPVALLSATRTFRPRDLVASVVYMAVDSYTSYTAYTEESSLQYLQDGWELDDAAAERLDRIRRKAFAYMVEIVDQYDLPGAITPTEQTVDDYVTWKNNENVLSRIQFFESNANIYSSYGGYWLTLANSYYETGDYQKCLEAIGHYDSLGIEIFRRDYDLAKVLPAAITSAEEVLSEDDYISYASENTKRIVANTDQDDWALRYYAAGVYLDLYVRTGEKTYLEEAYDITLNTINHLLTEQKSQNASYLVPIIKAEAGKDASKDEKEQIKKYNKLLEEERKVAAPPVLEPLRVNLDLLLVVSDELGVSEAEKVRVDGLLHPAGSALFLTKPLDRLYWLEGSVEEVWNNYSVIFGGNVIVLPVEAITGDVKVIATITNEAGETESYSDWKIKEVNRGKSSGISEFEVALSSEAIKDHSWKEGDRITLEIFPDSSIESLVLTREFTAETTKMNPIDYVSGYKNNWWNYFMLWQYSVRFVEVE